MPEMPDKKIPAQQIPIDKLRDLPGMAGSTQPDKSYGTLVSSILINGLNEPVILRLTESGEYQLVDGYRRKRAAELAKLKELPALVYDMTEKEALDYRARAAKDPETPLPGKPAEKAPDKKAKKPSTKSKAPEAKEEAPTGTAATGPTGTTITKILDSKLYPPTAKDKKSLPVPGEGETFSVILHPAFLKKAEINTFSVDRSADDFKELYKSIERFGVKDPVLARIGADGEPEILSGQRRHIIASELNYPVPTIIQQLDDDDARILVADGNLHREHISTYDQSRALRMKADSMKRKAGRRSKNDDGPRMDTDEILAKEMGMSVSKLNRLMKLSEATKGVCELVDEGTLATSIAYNIAFLTPQVQDMVVDLVNINVKVSNENTGKLKEIAKTETLDPDKVRGILEGKYPPPKVMEKPKAAEPVSPPPSPTPSMAPTKIPKSPDLPEPPKEQPKAEQPPAKLLAEPANSGDGQDRENSYETKIVLRGDRLRKYFPDVSMTPREIENSVYDALEERRQRVEKAAQKADIFKGKKAPVR